MKFNLVLATVLVCITASAQDGKIIEQIKINASADSIVKPSSQYYDTLTKILEGVDIYRITYISDGLKIFIIQGTGDGRVTSPQVFDLAEIFYSNRQPFRLSLFEGGGHGVSEFYDESTQQTKLFFQDYLRDGKKWPDLDLH